MAKPKSAMGLSFIEGKPKKSKQGCGKNSRPRKDKKKYRGQGRR